MSILHSFDYAAFSAVAFAFCFGLYAVLDGFDLGVGILIPFAPRSTDRDAMMESLDPFWDGSEAWLVLGGITLLTGFPLAFAVVMPALCVPLALMLFGFLLRGISFAFRGRGGPLKIIWSFAFAAGSIIAGFCQGAFLGALVGGIPIVNGHFAGGLSIWLILFSIVTGLGFVAGYGLLGACWLIWKTRGPTQVFGRELTVPTLLCTGAFFAIVSIGIPLALPRVAGRWSAWPNFLMLTPLMLIAVAAWIGVWRVRWGTRDWAPFALSLLFFFISLAGVGASVWPAAIPVVMKIWDTLSMHPTQAIMVLALVIIVPIILGYVVYGCWLVRGNVRPPSDLA